MGWGLLGNGAVPETMVRKAIGYHPREAHRNGKVDIWRSFKTKAMRARYDNVGGEDQEIFWV